MISITILTKNSEASLETTLKSVALFDEVILLDTGSTDRTVEIAKTFPNVKVHHSPFLGFGPTHNLATSFATHDWILSLDSDEALSPELAEEIKALALDRSTVYSILRHNFFNGKRIKWCGGWHPDWVVRLYHRKTTSFTDDAVHEKVRAEGLKVHLLQHPMTHKPYREIADFLSKMQTYTTLFASQHRGKKDASLLKAIFHGWFAFFKSYILKRGFMGGREGFIISAYNGHTAFYKYLKLSETI